MEKKKQMEQSATSSSSLLASATVDEIIVSQILLDLKNLMSLSESLSGFNWGCRRRRSCLEAPPALTSACSSLEHRIEELRIKVEEAEDENKHGGGARTTASPDTPLSFSPSESDEKPKHSSKKTSSKKRSREEYLDTIEGLSQRKELLTGEIQNVMKYYNSLKAQNSYLKALRREALGSKLYLGTESAQHYRIDTELHHQPSTSNPTANDCGHYFGPIAAHLDDRLGRGGPLGFDLNLPAEEAFGVELYRPLDVNRAIADKRARFAQARKKRIDKIIEKTMKKTKSSRTMG